MPYKLFEKTEDGKKLYCAKSLRTGKVYCSDSKGERDKAIKIREAFAHIPKAKRRKMAAGVLRKRK